MIDPKTVYERMESHLASLQDTLTEREWVSIDIRSDAIRVTVENVMPDDTEELMYVRKDRNK